MWHLLIALSLLAFACSSPEAPETRPACLPSADVACAPLYPPTFDSAFTQTFSQKCATGGASCHGPAGRKGGLILASADEAYALLLGTEGPKARVVPGDPRCSELMVRLDSVGKPWSMPPGAHLSDAERCAIRQWIEKGALR